MRATRDARSAEGWREDCVWSDVAKWRTDGGQYKIGSKNLGGLRQQSRQDNVGENQATKSPDAQPDKVNV